MQFTEQGYNSVNQQEKMKAVKRRGKNETAMNYKTYKNLIKPLS